MTDDHTPPISRPHVANYFGGCPTCGQTDGYTNNGADHWFTCKAHGVRWRAGTNLFSGWKDESWVTAFMSRRLLRRLRVVEPLPACDMGPGACDACLADNPASAFFGLDADPEPEA